MGPYPIIPSSRRLRPRTCEIDLLADTVFKSLHKDFLGEDDLKNRLNSSTLHPQIISAIRSVHDLRLGACPYLASLRIVASQGVVSWLSQRNI
ncbi:hypothetical protein L1987_04688 [Smallanthus sonchifolius]|uniref:Uncharacterized protein n=1 Tax=Smallanthus sonchifolius TaxID=185202 RepID=A0ACB9JTG3_9ASTR|nr:hypothetical protein L1987_04688 [Smallanthus sonchifolius]